MRKRVQSIIDTLLAEVIPSIHTGDEGGYVVDPVFGIVRNRVNAEVCKTLVRCGKSDLAEPLVRFLLNQQNKDGSWNEIHPNYNQPSALVTSFVGESLLAARDIVGVDEGLTMAKEFVLRQEKRPGFFLKSAVYNADHLNVDAACGAFLAGYAEYFSDEAVLRGAGRVADHILCHQRDGIYPYTIDRGNYPYVYDLPCVHYQGVTMYYLLKINKILDRQDIVSSLLDAARWLASVQTTSGQFDWSQSGLTFAHYLGGASAFAFSSFEGVSHWDDLYHANAIRCLDALERSIDHMVLRWEPASITSLAPACLLSLRAATVGDFPLRHVAFRFGYGIYRQIARRRFGHNGDAGLFNALCQVCGIQASTIEPMHNYPDMFMTSEVLDCLSYTLENGGV
jgi:hypothetical protein